MSRKDFALYLGFILILVLAFSLRLYNLDERVFHHDEAAVGYYTYKLFNDGIYSYDPAFHGPFMYYATADMFRRFGDNIYSARLLPALFGAGMIILLIPLRRYIGSAGMLISAFFLALSPSFLYYSRFYREDIFISFFTMLALVCAVGYAEKLGNERYSFLRIFYLSLGGIALASMAALKENAYIAMALIGLFLFLIFIRERLYKGFVDKIKSDKGLIIIAEGLFFVLVVMVVFSLFYTGKVFDIHGMQLAVEKAVFHWYEMHRIQRIGGPWFFYLPIIALYELPVLIFGSLGILYYCCRYKVNERMLIILLLYWITADLMYYISGIYPGISKFLPTSYVSAPIVIFFPLFIFGIRTVLKSQSIFFAFLTFWATTNLIIYSYLQEKVPWLVLNPLLPLVIIAAAYIGELLSSLKLRSKVGMAVIILFIATSAYMVYSSVFLNYYDYTNPAEPLIQAAQPPQKYSLFIDKIFEISRQYRNQSTEVQLADVEMETQFLWYLRHYGNIKWKVSIDSELNAPLIVVHDSDGNESDANIVQRRLGSDYMRLDSARMSWYWFKPSDVTLDYLLYRKMDRPPGEYRTTLFYKPKV